MVIANDSIYKVGDSVCRVAKDSGLRRSLNTLTTHPGARNPFVTTQNPKTAPSQPQSDEK
jgi:hypothetical protein